MATERWYILLSGCELERREFRYKQEDQEGVFSVVGMKSQIPKTSAQKLPMEQLRVLDICQQIFKLAEEFYQYLAEVHQEQGDVARIWGLLAIDRCNHAETFKMSGRLKGEGISEIYITAETALNILDKMKTIPRRDGHKPPSAADALRFAIKMEERLNTVHFRHVVKYFSEPDMDLMVSTLKSSGNILHILTEEYVNLTMFE